MLVIGLTGGIASGKTTISEQFSSLGITVIDTDIISRSLLEKGKDGYQAIVEKLGDSILLEDGNVDRRELRQQIFNNEDLKYWLESMLHPLIMQSAKSQIKSCRDSAYVVLVVPLLFESKFEGLVDRILVVNCTRETQLQRLLDRDKIDISLAEKMLDQQISNEDRLSRADDIISNDGRLELEPEIIKLHEQYLTMA